MASVRAQIFAAVDALLQDVLAELGWKTFLHNPREPLGTDQMDAIAMMDGGDREPDALTGGISDNELTFSVAWVVEEPANPGAGETAEEKLDAGYVAISDKLLDPTNIQLGGLAVGIFRGAIDDPQIGRPERSGRYMGAQAMDFRVRYFEREGDASSVGP